MVSAPRMNARSSFRTGGARDDRAHLPGVDERADRIQQPPGYHPTILRADPGAEPRQTRSNPSRMPTTASGEDGARADERRDVTRSRRVR